MQNLKKKIKHRRQNRFRNSIKRDMENEWKSVQNRPQKWWKIRENRALGLSWSTLGTLLAPRWCKMRVGRHLGLHVDACWGASWHQDGPSWSQDDAMLANLAPRCAQAGELGGYLARSWEHLGDFFCILGAILPQWAKTKKTMIVNYF